MPTATYDLLASSVLSSATTSVTFSSIPTTGYRDLVVVCNWQNSGTSSAARIQLNGDTGSNYSGMWITGTGSTTASSSESGQTSSRAAGANVGPDNAFTNIMTIQFMDANTTNKQKMYLVRFGSANREAQFTCSKWNNTAAITSIRIFDILGQTFSSGSTFYLYGIAS